MNRMHYLLLIALAGCSPAVPAPGEYLPAISVALGVAADHTSPAPPQPPAPKPGDKCDNCGGTGKLGDGTVWVDCPQCDDGVIPAATPSAIEAKQPRTGNSAPVRASAPPAAAADVKPAAGVKLPPATRVRARVAYVCGPDGKCRQVIRYVQ